jgi:hypothetical protein
VVGIHMAHHIAFGLWSKTRALHGISLPEEETKLQDRMRVPQSIPNYAACMAYSNIDTSPKYATLLSSVCV